MRHVRRTRPRRAAARLAIALIVAVAMTGLGRAPAEAGPFPVEEMASLRGPWPAVTFDQDGDFEDDGDGACSRTTRPREAFTLVYPEPLGFGGEHPVVVWANGTDIFELIGAPTNSTCYYQDFLEHLASWGFVVIAPNDGQTGSGAELGTAVEIAHWLDAFDSSTNPFHGTLDTDRIATAGHSQGAAGAINAARNAPDGVIDSVLALSMPDRAWIDWANANIPRLCQLGGRTCDRFDVPPGATNELGVPIFLARGTGVHNVGCAVDDYFSDQTHVDWRPPAGTSTPYLFATFGADPPEDPARCNPPTPAPIEMDPPPPVVFPHPVDLYPHVELEPAYAYGTAWLVYTLTCFGIADDAFTGAAPEIARNGRWSSVIRGDLPTCP